jgi:trimeric autotransporter adhesin
MYVPYLSGGDAGVALSVQSSVSNVSGIVQRTPGGVWQALGTGTNAGTGVFAVAYGLDGKLYAGGEFATMGGVANTAGIAYWDGAAWNALTTGVSGGAATVRAIAVAPNGDIYVAGDFTLAGGVANTDGIAKWNGSAWSALGTGVSGGTARVGALAFDSLGNLYAGGVFTAMGGVANTARIAKWNGSAWSALSTGMSAEVFALVVDPANNLYAGGVFGTAGGVAATASPSGTAAPGRRWGLR